MGRIAGVTAEETRKRVLASAASVFAQKGYDGASIAEIAGAAGVTGGAIYAHFPSKAELFAATLHAHGTGEIDRLLSVGDTGAEAIEMVHARGVALTHRDPQDGSLLIEAIVAARRHPEVAELIVTEFAQREDRFADLLRAGQGEGAIDGRIRPAAVARFISMVSLGSLLASAMGLPEVDQDDWANLIRDLVSRFSPPSPT